ncbi:hypothetical protein [Alkalicoccobacillus gibsonii]|jgi:predicted choloylglycine hydrolase|uniref:hypothetical protein n=1 Tax=Alkalicoccobacillus gibsonii TaxID=79881 RepID=UPI0019322F34|nr:hypothetical protein [Alkalicoccobacillus gibsonii]MBM0064039.1 hypothetical protein [Alkalicoccobacillus gibsonii]
MYGKSANELGVKSPGKKNIYKKSLAIDLIKCGHDFLHTMRNKHNQRYQIYVFTETPELIQDMQRLTKREDS